LALVALQAGFIDVVKASITGSIIGNVLLVLGGSMIAGGLKHKKQIFDRQAATAAATLLALAAISLTVPTVFHYIYVAPGTLPPVPREIKLALAIATAQLIVYFLSVFYTLQFKPGAQKSNSVFAWRSIIRPLASLLIASVFVAFLSECLVKSLSAGAETLGLNKIFIGVVLVAIIGNAAEHSTAILMAWKNKMDLAISIALGSGAQIALFVAPIIIFAGYFIGQPIDLRFTELELLSIIVSVIILAFVATDGECNWLEGVQLLAVYAILGAGFYFAG